MYSKYQIIKIFENYFPNMNWFSCCFIMLFLRHVFHRFCYFVLPHSTARHHKYWINQAICQAKAIKFIINLYTDFNTLWVKNVKHQKLSHQRAACLSKLDNTVNNNSISLYWNKVCWVLYKIVGVFFIFTTLCSQFKIN